MPALVSIKVKKNQSLCGKGFTKKSVPEMLVRSSRSHVTYEEVVLKDFPKLTAKQVETATGSFFLNIYIYIYIYIFSNSFHKIHRKPEITKQLFSCEFCEILRNSFFTEQLLGTASEQLPKVCGFVKIGLL